MLVKFPRRESGMSAIPFVVSLLFVVGLGVAWYNADKEATDLRAKAMKSAADATEWQKRLEAESNFNLELTEATGFGNAQGKPDKAAIQAALSAALDKWREKFTLEFAPDKYQATGTGGTVEKIAGEKIRVSYIPAKDQISNPSVQAILPLFEAAAARLLNDVKRYVESNSSEMKSKAEMLASKDKTISEKDTAYSGLQAQGDQTKRTLEEQVRELRDQLQAKDQVIQQAQAELETVKAEKDKAVAKLSSELSQKAAEIQTLVRRDQPFISEGPDGEVISAGAGVVIVGRGKKDMLMPGTVFDVLGRVKGGDLVRKGTIKVVVCSDETAQCAIVAIDDPNNPINGGDAIDSKTYSPGRTMHFSLVGEFKKMGRAQAEARLKQLGASVDAAVNSATHYLVVGTPGAGENIEESDSWKRAKEFGVTILTEAQLASFTMY